MCEDSGVNLKVGGRGQLLRWTEKYGGKLQERTGKSRVKLQ